MCSRPGHAPFATVARQLIALRTRSVIASFTPPTRPYTSLMRIRAALSDFRSAAAGARLIANHPTANWLPAGERRRGEDGHACPGVSRSGDLVIEKGTGSPAQLTSFRGAATGFEEAPPRPRAHEDRNIGATTLRKAGSKGSPTFDGRDTSSLSSPPGAARRHAGALAPLVGTR